MDRRLHTMKTNHRSRKTDLPISTSRWLAYTTAGAATALGCAGSVEAAITVIDVNQVISAPPGGNAGAVFALPESHSFSLNNLVSSYGFGAAGLGMKKGSQFIGFSVANNSGYPFAYPSRLSLGANIADGPFAVKAFGTLAFGAYSGPPWRTAGRGYIGFKFTDSAGQEYGWIDLTTAGYEVGSALTLNSYAYTTAGERITAGQTQVPEPGSLALLAAGGAGLLAWRQRRARSAALPSEG